MPKTFNVGVIGATGLVGEEILTVLAERQFPVAELRALASSRSAGEDVEFGDKTVRVVEATEQNLQGLDIVLMSAGSTASEKLAPIAAQAGAVVIDNGSYWRMDPEVPLVVPEVNPEAAAGYKAKNIIANPNCSTIQMVVALAPLHARYGLKRVVVSTYQAVSGAGKNAMEELGEQVRGLFNAQDVRVDAFPHRIAFNCLPHIDRFLDDGFTREEHKMIDETRKIMGIDALAVCPTCVRVPVFNGHAEAVVAEFAEPFEVDEAREALRGGKGLVVVDEPEKSRYPMQIDAEGQDATLVGRIRRDPSAPNSLAFWVVADNLRKGAATNAVQIAEIVAREHLS